MRRLHLAHTEFDNLVIRLWPAAKGLNSKPLPFGYPAQ
jgi:hypothetical protein